jgi:hypothetical protein
MTDRSSELTLVLQSSATRIVVHGSLLRCMGGIRSEGMHNVSARPRVLASNALLTSVCHETSDDFESRDGRSISIRIDWASA